MRNGKHIHPDGDVVYYVSGMLHRTDGPAVLYTDGKTEWWLRGSRVSTIKEYRFTVNITDEEMASLVLKYGGLS